MRYMLILLGLMFANVANALDCDVAPTCEELGYSTEDDPYCAENGYMYCPLDRSYKKCVNMDCTKLGFTEDDKTSWCNKLVKCKGNPRMTLCQNLCEVGDVYYSDGTCGKVEQYEPNSSREPVGVVFWLKDNGAHGKVVALKGARALNKHSYEPTYYQTNNEVLFNGKKNTQDMLKGKVTDKKCLDGTYIENSREWEVYCQATSAILCLAYVPENVDSNNPIVGAGQWYMPSIGELMQLYGTDAVQMTEYAGNSGATGETLKIVYQTMDGLQSKNINTEKFSGWYRSSTRGGYSYMFCTLNMSSGSRSNDLTPYSFPTRPVLEF